MIFDLFVSKNALEMEMELRKIKCISRCIKQFGFWGPRNFSLHGNGIKKN